MILFIGPDLSLNERHANGTTTSYGDLHHLRDTQAKILAQLTTQHLADAAQKYPELAPALAEFRKSLPAFTPPPAHGARSIAPQDGEKPTPIETSKQKTERFLGKQR